MKVLFKDKNPSASYLPLDFNYEVNRYTKAAIGGCKNASISVRGAPEQINRFIGMLRYPVEIFDDSGVLRWWGYLHGVEARYGSRSISVSLGNMYNKIAVLYGDLNPGVTAAGSSVLTSWASDSFSISRYGTKERILPLSSATLEIAEGKRDTLLAQYKLPALIPHTGMSEGGSYSALLTCKGWFNTFDWVYAVRAAGQEGLTVSSSTTQAVGKTDEEQVKQSFVLSSSEPWTADSVSIRIAIVGSPSDNVKVAIHSHSGGVLGAELASGTVAASSLDTTYPWVQVSLTSRYLLQVATEYAVVVSRTGALNDTDYYRVRVDEALGYTNGSFAILDDTVWSSRSPDADLIFRVNGVEQTSDQIEWLIDNFAEFAGRVDVETASGKYSNPYRDGRATLHYSIREMLGVGDLNTSRYLLEVRPDLTVRVYPEPTTPEFLITVDDRWLRNNVAVPKAECPVGVLYELGDRLSLAGSYDVYDPGVYFVEENTYEVSKDQLNPEPRGSGSPYDVVELI